MAKGRFSDYYCEKYKSLLVALVTDGVNPLLQLEAYLLKEIQTPLVAKRNISLDLVDYGA